MMKKAHNEIEVARGITLHGLNIKQMTGQININKVRDLELIGEGEYEIPHVFLQLRPICLSFCCMYGQGTGN